MNAKEFLQNGERTKVQDMIAQVRDKTLREILTKHYAGGQTWEQVAEELNYSVRGVYRLHRKALAAVQGIIDEQ